jgi:hypothetical protein
MNKHDRSFADDLLYGADAVAEFVYGSRSFRRRIYHLAATSKIPLFKLGSMICGRKSVLLTWIERQEDK